ncbi:MAG: hypothetical protein WD060_14770 [Pirellulales bacterium]
MPDVVAGGEARSAMGGGMGVGPGDALAEAVVVSRCAALRACAAMSSVTSLLHAARIARNTGPGSPEPTARPSNRVAGRMQFGVDVRRISSAAVRSAAASVRSCHAMPSDAASRLAQARLTPPSASLVGGVSILPFTTIATLAVDVSLIRPSAWASTALAPGSIA